MKSQIHNCLSSTSCEVGVTDLFSVLFAGCLFLFRKVEVKRSKCLAKLLLQSLGILLFKFMILIPKGTLGV